MYIYNRQYIEQQIMGPFLIFNTVTFLFFTLVMIIIGQNSADLSKSIHANPYPDTFFTRAFGNDSSAPAETNTESISSENAFCHAMENAVLPAAMPSYGLCQVYILKDAKHNFNTGFNTVKYEYIINGRIKDSDPVDALGRSLNPADKLSPFHQKAIPFQPIIYQAAKRYEVEPAIIKAIIMAESSFNPKAVSHKGAQGLMQLMPRTARYLGVKDSFNPEHNIEGGVKYFKRLLDRFDGDIQLALAAYNAGSRNVRKYKGVPPFKATKVYIKKVLKYYEEYKTT